MTYHQSLRLAARRTYYRARWLVARHPWLTLMWLAIAATMTTATAANHEPAARCALFASAVALLASMVAVARWVIARMTHIVALWEEDVPLTSNATNLYPLHRGERAKDHA